jgi:hypothetical protein
MAGHCLRAKLSARTRSKRVGLMNVVAGRSHRSKDLIGRLVSADVAESARQPSGHYLPIYSERKISSRESPLGAATARNMALSVPVRSG